ncbi:MAG: selenide, water dikinase SelD [Planctomycetaceae bacterium]
MHTPPPGLPPRELVLLGAGHAHLHVIRMWGRQPIPGFGLTVVNDSSLATYSGMYPGVIAGLYSKTEASVDLWRFVPACGGRLIVAPVQGFDASARRVLFADRPPLAFDVASIALGSTPTLPQLTVPSPRLLSAKPLGTLLDRLAAALAVAPPPGPHASPLRVALVGGGAGGFELTLALQRWFLQQHRPVQLTLLDSHAQILSGASSRTRASALQVLAERGIRHLTSHRLRQIRPAEDDGALATHAPLVLDCTDPGGQPLPPVTVDLVVCATSATPPAPLQHCDLPKDPQGFLLVDATLRTTTHQPVFVTGDCASFATQPLRKAGVYAVRQGPILWDNLGRLAANQPLTPFQPQRSFLSLLSLGDGQALADYRGLSFRGSLAWRLKDSIDRRFLRQYQPEHRSGMSPLSGRSTSPPLPQAAHSPAAGPMRCTGCGSKVSAEVLAEVLQRLQPNSVSATGSLRDIPDDAVLLQPPEQPVDVWSVDFFPAFLDDPCTVGRIAALHSLSDVWAMGADPVGALAIASVPAGPPRQQAELLFQLLSGAVREFTSAGATLMGGHTLEADLLQIGFSVLGRLGDRPAWRRSLLQPGDQLILTKPLGTGAILAGLAQHQSPAPAVDAALAHMLQSNATAARIGRQWPIRAATDITGFGLAGHLLEMLHASRCSGRLQLDAVPLLPGFRELARLGVLSSLDPANRARARPALQHAPALEAHPAWPALFDPQTSGGLLLACPSAAARPLLHALHSAGLPHAACVGAVIDSSEAGQLFVS